jgi:AraC-like DNA-binding protein
VSIVLVLTRSDQARRRMTDHRPPFPYRFVELVSEFESAAREGELLAFIVDVVDRRGQPTAPAVARILQGRADMPGLLWCARGDAGRPEVAQLVGAGISAVLFHSSGPYESIAIAGLVPRGALGYHQWVDATLHRSVPEPVRALVSFCLHPANAALTVPEAAAALHLPRRTLTHRLAAAGMPHAKELLIWSRALHAAWELEHEWGKPVERIALDHDFASATALRGVFLRLIGESPAELRDHGGFGWVLRCFDRTLASAQRGHVRAGVRHDATR